MNLFIDIETIPCQRPDLITDLVADIKAPSTYKDEAKIEAYIRNQQEPVVSKTALDGTFGEIVCIGFAVDDEPVATVSRTPGNTEATVLYEFFEKLSGNFYPGKSLTHPRWIGHNVCFDVRFLWQRCIINRVPMTVGVPHDAKQWSPGIYDTLWEWCGTNTRGHGLEMLCKVFNLPSKPFKSSEVSQYWANKDILSIASLCAHDVDVTRKLYNLMQGVK